MNNSDLISVIVPVFNMEKYLSRCLDSICNNTYKNLEIICINDGSTDSSLDILNEYAKRDNRIIVVDQENKKLSAARNAGLDIANGKWIAFIDSDDWIHRQYFEILLDIAYREKAHVSICNCLSTSETCITEESLKEEEIHCKIIRKKELDRMHTVRSRVWGKLYRRDMIGDLRFVSGTEPIEDMFFNTILLNERMIFSISDLKIYYYFIRPDSAVNTTTGRKSLVFAQHMIPLIQEQADSEKRREMVKRCYNNLLSSRYREMFSKDFEAINRMIDTEFHKLEQYRKYLPVKERFIYTVLRKYPSLYRAWRILDDPTLLKYEASIKE